jgi:putative transposase
MGSNRKNINGLSKYTAQQMNFKMIDTNNQMLNEFLVDAKDRQYQIWK